MIQNNLKNKMAIVTGGTRGIGRAVSEKLARQGASVLALYARDSKSAQELLDFAQKENLSIQCLKGDLGHPEKREKLVQQIKDTYPQIDILVHCAASGVHRPAMELSVKHLQWTYEINVFSFHYLVTQLYDRMPKGSRIVGITSSGSTRVIPFYAAIGSSKGALESLIRHYAFELAPQGISVNAVCPGLVLTEATEAFPDREARIEKSIQATPTHQLTNVTEVAELVSFLCEPGAAQIVGQTLVIDGGKTLLS